MKTKKVKAVVAKKVPKQKAPESPGMSMDDKFNIILGLLEQSMRSPQVEAPSAPMMLSEFSMPQTSTREDSLVEVPLTSVGISVPAVNDEWTRGNIMAKIGTLESRVDTLWQAMGVVRKDLMNLAGRR